MDVLTPEQRRHNMSRIRGKDTKPEMILRRGLHAAGLRFRLYVRDLPGRPDLVFSRHRAVVLVHGCFWHGHGCPICKPPTTRTEFWMAKLEGNRMRDQRSTVTLRNAGWRVLTVWECSLKGPARLPRDILLRRCEDFIRGQECQMELAGSWFSYEGKV